MNLTGQCQKDFECWLLNRATIFEEDYNLNDPDHFYQLSEAMQFGVYQEWANTINIQLIAGVEYVAKCGTVSYISQIIDISNGEHVLKFEANLKTYVSARLSAVYLLDAVLNYD